MPAYASASADKPAHRSQGVGGVELDNFLKNDSYLFIGLKPPIIVYFYPFR